MMPAQTYHSVSLQVLAITMLSAVTYAQTVTGNVEGRVIDPAGAVVPGATVRAKEASTGALRATRTNSDGFYEFSYLRPGDYKLTRRSTRFERQSGRAGVTLNRTTLLNFQLALPGVRETVTVTESAPAIDLVSGQIRRSMESDEIAAIPLMRNIVNLGTFRRIPDQSPPLTRTGPRLERYFAFLQRNWFTLDYLSNRRRGQRR